ncbi:MAG: hypothetical protein GWP15_02675 [Nitrospirae bacterium]|nr:hypothetical protein [Nitrospirota bacterium]
MKLRALFIALMATTLVFTGCLSNTSTEVTESGGEELDDGFDTGIYGTWNRTGIYIDGVNVATESATTMFMEDGTYTSFGTCTVNGGYIVVDDVLNVVINDHDCPGFTGPYESTSTFKISEDGEGLTISTASVSETFDRATE